MSPVPFLGDDARANQRRAGRLRCPGLICSLGEVVDLSATGLRVRAKADQRIAKGAGVEFTLQAGSAGVRMRATIVWTRPEGRVVLLGLRFLNPTDDQRARLLQLARAASEG